MIDKIIAHSTYYFRLIHKFYEVNVFTGLNVLICLSVCKILHRSRRIFLLKIWSFNKTSFAEAF